MKLQRARTKAQMLAGIEGVVKSRIIRHSTVHYETGAGSFIRYHFTDIIAAYKDGRVVLQNGRYYTRNTKLRLNDYLKKYGLSITSDGTDWWVRTRTGDRHRFYDGITFKNWRLASEDEEDKGRRALKKKIAAYAKRVGELKEIPEPGSGDCRYCSMHTEDGKPIGEGDTEHLRSHVEEGYIHGSLIWNALEHCGYNPHCVQLHGRRTIAKSVKNYLHDMLGFPR